MSSLLKLVKVRKPTKYQNQEKNDIIRTRMVPMKWTLTSCHSLEEIRENIDEYVGKEWLVTIHIVSCEFELPPSGSGPIFENKFPHLECLHITDNNIPKLSSRTFYYLENLRYLELKKNNIHEIEENAFDDLPSLYSLIICNNQIQQLKNGVFDGLDQLGSLVLNNNGIKTIQSEVFRNMRSLFNLELHDNYIEELPENIFRDLENLGNLILRNNKLQWLPSKIFTPLKRLNYLDVSHNVIRELPKNLLRNFTMAGHYANFRYNEIAQINESALEDFGIPSGVLHLGENGITTLKTGSFHKVTAKTINLRENKIDCIQPGAFEGCCCEELILNYNELSKIHSDSFRGLKINCNLSLSHNYITHISGLFHNFGRLQKLELPFNIISKIPSDAFKGLANLNVLILNNNRIKRIEEDCFSGLPNLTYLTLHENFIEDLHENCFAALPNLASLILSSNRLKTMQPNILAHNFELYELNVMNNDFTELPPSTMYRNAEKLRNIDFSFNRINKLKVDSFASEGDNKEFHIILLRSSQIMEIETGAFNGIEHVKYLVLSSNLIADLPNYPFKGLKSVYRLEFENNKFTPYEYLSALPPTIIVTLTENPLKNIELDDLNSLDLNHIRAISFRDHSFKRDGNTWSLVNYEIEDIEEELTVQQD